MTDRIPEEERPFAIMVIGPESSGTRLVTRIMIAAGCRGDGQHKQRHDTDIPRAVRGKPIVWRRSMPHLRQWPDLVSMAEKLNDLDYVPAVIITHREWYAMARSQIANGHAPSMSRATANIKSAYEQAYRWTHGSVKRWMTVTYESVLLHPAMTAQSMAFYFGLMNPGSRFETIKPGRNALRYEAGVDWEGAGRR